MSKLARRQPLGTHSEPVWRLYECERGARWSTAMNFCAMDRPCSCDFSGQTCGRSYHACRIVSTTSDRMEAASWFRLPPADHGQDYHEEGVVR